MNTLTYAAELVTELEETNQDKVDILERTIEDMATKIDQLMDENESLVRTADGRMKIYTASLVLVFSYALFYGVYFGCTISPK